MRAEGWEFRDIADELGVGLATAYRWAGRSEVAA
jgi:transposase